MITKKINYLLLAGSLLSLTTSCDKWLDVQPNSQIKTSELFTTESGYKEALAGVYTILTDEKAYGKELTYGMMGVLSHEWNSYASAYDDDGNYNYTEGNSRSRIENVWSQLYKAISNTNNILENIDQSTAFSGNNKEIIKGEALALRAFAHFDLLRCFGVSYSTNPQQPSIPYVTKYTSNQTAQSSVNEVIEKAIADLIQAKELLKVDPIFTGKTITESDDNGYLINRQLHLNYYAVEALLARIYLYKGDYSNARIAAQKVIDSKKFTFSTQQNIISQVDLCGAPEQIFALQINNLSQYSEDYLSQTGTSTIFSLTRTMLNSYYETNTNDYRFEYLFKQGTAASADKSYTLKFSESTSTSAYYKSKMPIIKLAEMYYILAECDNEENISPLANINAVRVARGLDNLTNISNFRTLMTNEFRKEFLAEGQLFYYYKRNNIGSIQNSDADLIQKKAYTFPIPDSEIEAANRLNNR